MTGAEVLTISRDAILTLLKIGAPLMLSALAVGLVISFFQALTQIQEMTLSFVPKIIALFLVLLLLLPFIGESLQSFTQQLFDLMSQPRS